MPESQPNDSSGTKRFMEAVEFHGPVSFFQLPRQYDNVISASNTTPDVSGIKVLIPAGSTITNFKNGAKNQTIRVLGDGATTISNNANIKTNTGANKLLSPNKMFRFTLYESTWYEDD